ncbi:CLUMA_CG004726, isoform A [Clunio marinus]|uniref:CLUMA_CG004726, isoform A n=1 Tax=Clunio marinus TaxID=568069 RepID=A0A1J1HWY3_9DIPT|nr:CLUMA_CG004726, isoform A [Clunio marinus]
MKVIWVKCFSLFIKSCLSRKGIFSLHIVEKEKSLKKVSFLRFRVLSDTRFKIVVEANRKCKKEKAREILMLIASDNPVKTQEKS